VITPPAGVKGVTRAGTPFVVLHLQILQTQAKINTSSLPRRCLFAQKIF
jgi:diaminopimelate decarboxylase